jgi:hypothetical protein
LGVVDAAHALIFSVEEMFPVLTCADLNYEDTSATNGWREGRVVTGYMSTKVLSGWRNDFYWCGSTLCFLSVDGLKLDVTVMALAFLSCNPYTGSTIAR